VGLVAEPADAAAHGLPGERRDGAAGDDQLHVGHLGAGPGGVPAVGPEQVAAVGAHQQRAVGAGEAGQVADVEQVRHQDGVQPLPGCGGAQRVPPIGSAVHPPHHPGRGHRTPCCASHPSARM
jgi:hypothetical protein